MCPILLRPHLKPDADVDAELAATLGRSDNEPRSGRVGPGAALASLAGDTGDPDALLSYFGPGTTRLHRVFSSSKVFACPVYSHPERKSEHHVFDVWVPSSIPAQHWILRGVYLLL